MIDKDAEDAIETISCEIEFLNTAPEVNHGAIEDRNARLTDIFKAAVDEAVCDRCGQTFGAGKHFLMDGINYHDFERERD